MMRPMNEITVKTIEEIAAYEGPHEIPGIRFRHARAAMGISAWGMNALELDKNVDGYPEHDHVQDRQEELYVVLRGVVYLQTKDGETRLTAGAMARVPPDVKRKLVTKEEPATILAIGGVPGAAYDPDKGM